MNWKCVFFNVNKKLFVEVYFIIGFEINIYIEKCIMYFCKCVYIKNEIKDI